MKPDAYNGGDLTVDHPNVALVKRLYAARTFEEWDDVASCFAVDAIWQYSGPAPVGRTYRGALEIVGLCRGIDPDRARGLSPKHVLANDELVVACEVTTLENRSSKNDQDYVHIFLVRDTKIIRAKSFQCVQTSLNDLWW